MEYALITGASNGIGLELAKIFARQKINLILVARSEEKLQKLSEEIKSNGIDVMIYIKDLSDIKNAEDLYNDITEKKIIIRYLVNNAGFGTSGEFCDISWEREYMMFNLNMVTLAYFTKKFALDMKNRGAGRILNIASTASLQPGPYMAAYSATKAFVSSLSQAVSYELKGTGVTLTTLCPGLTNTGFVKTADLESTTLNKMGTANAKDVAEYGFKIMMKGKRIGIHGFQNKIMAILVNILPAKFILPVAAKILSHK